MNGLRFDNIDEFYKKKKYGRAAGITDVEYKNIKNVENTNRINESSIMESKLEGIRFYWKHFKCIAYKKKIPVFLLPHCILEYCQFTKQ